MKRLIDQNKSKIIEELEKKESLPAPILPPPSSGIDLKDLIGKTRTILYREISNLMQESTAGLLSKDSSQALIGYINLLTKLIKEEDSIFDDMTDEQLEEILAKTKKK